MKCDYIRIGDTEAIVCGSDGRRRQPLKVCCGCRMLTARKQCDWKIPYTGPKPFRTCDAWICEKCATSVGPDKDLCPTHAKEWAEHPKNPARKSASSTTERTTE